MSTGLARDEEVVGGNCPKPAKVMFLEITLRVGGAERVLCTLVESFDRARVQPVIVTLRDPGAIGEQLIEKNVPVYHNLLKGKFDLCALWALVKTIRKEKPDIIYTCNYPMTIFYGRLAGMLAGVKTHVVALHSIGYVARSRWRRLSLIIAKAFIAKFVAVSDGQRVHYCKTHGLKKDRVEVIYVGIDAERFSPGSYDLSARDEFNIPCDAKVVGILAVLRPEKRHDVFLKMAASIARSRKDTYFLIVGDGPERERLENMARDMGISEFIRFAGSRSDVPRVLRAFDVSVLCSGQLVETSPQSLIESMAMELPVVSTNVGSIDEIVQDGVTGFLTPDDDIEALTNKVLDLLQDTELACRMGKAGRRRVEEIFTRSIMVSHFEEFFQRITR